MRGERGVGRVGAEIVVQVDDAAEHGRLELALTRPVEPVQHEPRHDIGVFADDNGGARDGDIVHHRRALGDQRRPVGVLGIRIARRHQFPVRRVAVGAEVDAVAAEDRVGVEFVARVDRPRRGGRVDGTDLDRVRPEIAGFEHGDRSVFGLVDVAPVLRVVHRDQEFVGRALRAELVPIAAMRLLFRVALGGPRRDERERFVARPVELADAGQDRADLGGRGRVDDAEVLDLGTARVDADRRARRLAIRDDAPIFVLPEGSIAIGSTRSISRPSTRV